MNVLSWGLQVERTLSFIFILFTIWGCNASYWGSPRLCFLRFLLIGILYVTLILRLIWSGLYFLSVRIPLLLRLVCGIFSFAVDIIFVCCFSSELSVDRRVINALKIFSIDLLPPILILKFLMGFFEGGFHWTIGFEVCISVREQVKLYSFFFPYVFLGFPLVLLQYFRVLLQACLHRLYLGYGMLVHNVQKLVWDGFYFLFSVRVRIRTLVT